MVCWGSVPSGAQDQRFPSRQDQITVVGTTGNNSLVTVDVCSSLLGQQLGLCFTVIPQSPSHPTALSGPWAYGAREVPSTGMAAGMDNPVLGAASMAVPTPPNIMSAVCPVTGGSLSEAGGPWEMVCKTVSPLIPKSLTRSDSAFASSWQSAYLSVWLLNTFSPLLCPASLTVPQSDQTEPPACEHSLYFSAIP